MCHVTSHSVSVSIPSFKCRSRIGEESLLSNRTFTMFCAVGHGNVPNVSVMTQLQSQVSVFTPPPEAIHLLVREEHQEITDVNIL